MGLFDWLRRLRNWFRNLFGARRGETQDDVADRIERAGDRFRNAGDLEAEQAARVAAADARRAPTVEAARQIEQDFYRSRGLQPDGRPVRPVVGSSGSRQYVRYGSSARVGGSTGWRYNNPGYLRCGDRATRYGAIGCDGVYAIFPDHRTGTIALREHLRTEYPNHRVEDALRQQLPPAEAQAAVESLRAEGFDVGMVVGAATAAELEQISRGCAEVSGSDAGDVVAPGPDAPEWAGALWSPAPEMAATTEPETGGESGSTGRTDDS